jgi:hypothetical protein
MLIALGVWTLCVALPHAVDAQAKTSPAAARDGIAGIERAVWKRARYAVIVADMHDGTSTGPAGLAPSMTEGVVRKLRKLERVVVLKERDATDKVLARLGRRKMPTLRIEGRIMSLERGELDGQPSVRCQVSLMLMDEHGRALRSIMRGAATGIEEPSGPQWLRYARTVQRALDGAVRSAMHGVRDVIKGAARHAQAPVSPDKRLAFRR